MDPYLFYGYYELVAPKSLKKDFASFSQANPELRPGLLAKERRLRGRERETAILWPQFIILIRRFGSFKLQMVFLKLLSFLP